MNQDLQGKIAYLQDENGDVHFPITAVEAIIGPNYNLGTKINELTHKIDNIPTGLQGPKGDTGETGPQGDKGDTGERGPKGDKGDNGAPFAIKKIYNSVEEMQAGYATDDVQNGEFVLINTGDVNDEDNAKLYVKGGDCYTYLLDLSGSQGIQGPQGSKGDRGLDGRSIELGVYNGQLKWRYAGQEDNVGWTSLISLDSLRGAQGEKGDTGDAGAQGPQGPKGEKGDTGETGPQGPKGDTPDVSEFVTMDTYLELLARVEALEAAQSPTTAVSH